MQKSLTIYPGLLLLIAVFSCETIAPKSDVEQIETDVFDLVNAHRASIGKGALVLETFITNECRGHSKDMAEGVVPLSHDGFDDRANRIFANLGGTSVGENVGNFRNAEEAVEWWLNSPDHKANIEGDFTHTGVGVHQHGTGQPFFTQMFLKK